MTNQVLTTNTVAQAMGITNVATGKVIADAGTATAETFTCGFVPRWIRFVNLTDRITDEWFTGMAAASSLHTVAAGTVTLEATHGITDNGDGTFTVDATTMVASKTFYWMAVG